MEQLAHRARMTEGQLYTTILTVLVVLLLSLTGLPTAEHARSFTTDGIGAPTPATIPAPEVDP